MAAPEKTAGSKGEATQMRDAPALVGSDRQKILRAGFIPLVDASVLIAAAEFGFADREGLILDLVKDVSWANVRDRLAFRQFDIAHMLSPMPVASMLGLGSNPSPTITPFSLGRGGNAITLSTRLFARMKALTGLSETAGALENARALKLACRFRLSAQLRRGHLQGYRRHLRRFRL